MNISFFELESFECEYFKEQLPNHHLKFVDGPLDYKTIEQHRDAEVLVVFVFSKVTAKIIENMPRLKIICTMSTGYDHIDIKAATEYGIKICTVPSYGQNTVAEHAFALLQALNRSLIPAVERTRSCNFDYTGLIGRDLAGKTMGVIGTGKIGQYFIQYAKAFGMRIVASDPKQNTALAKKIGFEYVSLDELCKQSDFISIHVPLLAHTKHLINKKHFDMMKSTVQIINTSRGSIIETQAMIEALDDKKIAGAALDVLEFEGDIKQEARLARHMYKDADRLCALVQNHTLLRRDNVIVTPHLAFYTHEAVHRILQATTLNIVEHSRNKYPHKVN